jgi:hypothetical protein
MEDILVATGARPQKAILTRGWQNVKNNANCKIAGCRVFENLPQHAINLHGRFATTSVEPRVYFYELAKAKSSTVTVDTFFTTELAPQSVLTVSSVLLCGWRGVDPYLGRFLEI